MVSSLTPTVVFRYDFFALFVLVIAYNALAIVVMRRMQFLHAAVWDELGRPAFLNMSPANTTRFLHYFIFSSRYAALEDVRLNSCVIWLRVLFAVFAVLFALQIFLIFGGLGAPPS